MHRCNSDFCHFIIKVKFGIFSRFLHKKYFDGTNATTYLYINTAKIYAHRLTAKRLQVNT